MKLRVNILKYHRRDCKIEKNQKKEHSLNPNLTRRIFVMNWKIKTKEKIVRIDDFDEHFMNPKRALKKCSVEIVCIRHASRPFFIQFSRLECSNQAILL